MVPVETMNTGVRSNGGDHSDSTGGSQQNSGKSNNKSGHVEEVALDKTRHRESETLKTTLYDKQALLYYFANLKVTRPDSNSYAKTINLSKPFQGIYINILYNC